VGGARGVPVRIHDQCFTSEVFRSQRLVSFLVLRHDDVWFGLVWFGLVKLDWRSNSNICLEDGNRRILL